MRWIAAELKAELQKLPHILRDSSDLVEKIAGMRLPADATMCKVDVKNYFMSGNQETLISQSSRSVREKHGRVTSDAWSYCCPHSGLTLQTQDTAHFASHADRVWAWFAAARSRP